MRRAGMLAMALLLAGCTSFSTESVRELPDFDRVYYVIFEEKPRLRNDAIFMKTLRIGKVIGLKPAGQGMHVAKISIDARYKDLMRDNVAFVVDDDRLQYETLGDEGGPLGEGSKLLGFPGRTRFTLFKTQNRFRGMSRSVMDKAEELYKRSLE
ncbi:MAG: hypothetical protein ACLFRG_01185 [Desulfococcaceae bacterium]